MLTMNVRGFIFRQITNYRKMKDLTKKFKALSDKQRIRILKMLEAKPMRVCEVAEVLQLAVSTVSKHLSILSDADFVKSKKQERWVYYRLNKEQGDEYTAQLLSLIHKTLSDETQGLVDEKKTRRISMK